MPLSVRRSVSWVSVAGRWTRMSLMNVDVDGDDISRAGSKGTEGDPTSRISIVMIPGNPGNEGFYEQFGREMLRILYSKWTPDGLRREFDFYTVSHLNHVDMPTELREVGRHKHCDRFSLMDQVQHKLDFCREYVPKETRVVLLGHSIGAYMMFRILSSLLEDGYEVLLAGSLFPTIEKMADSPNGRRLFPVLSTLNAMDGLLQVLLFWVDCLPRGAKKWLCERNLSTSGVPACVHNAAIELFHLNVFRNIVHMSVDELSTVCDLDESLLKHADRLKFYYGKTDGWCPLSYGEEMRDRLGDERVDIDENGCAHAFVIRDGEVMATKVADWVCEFAS